jgi:cbb3-type cytochrome oxidase subunit 3
MSFILNNSSEIGLVFFFTFFVGATLFTMRKGGKQIYDSYAKIPLQDE